MSCHIAILPASGQNFIAQLVIMQHLSHIGYKPNLLLGSSGGNLVAYICAAADFNSFAIERIAKELKPEFFVKPWHSSAPISTLYGFFMGSDKKLTNNKTG